MPASNLSTRTKYVKPQKLAEIFDLSRAQIYKMIKSGVLADAVFKPSEKLIRIDLDKAFEIMKQHFN